jgi:DNA-binding response OmpR family regulator
MKVMIYDHDLEKVKVIKDLLNVYNLKFITVTNMGTFYKQVETHKPAILILNDTFNGQQLNKLRSHPVTRNIPIILLSNSKNYRIKDGDNLTELFSEPFKIKHLRHVIDRWTTFRSLYIKQ